MPKPTFRSVSQLLATSAVCCLAVTGAATVLGLLAKNPAAATSSVFSASSTPGDPIATVDVYRVSAKLVGTEAYLKRMDSHRNELKKRMDPLDRELRDLAEKLKALGADNKSPEAEETARTFQGKQQDIMKLSQMLDRDMDSFVTGVNHEAYLLVMKTARDVARTKGYAYLLSTRAIDDGIAPTSAGAFMQSIMSRPVLMSPPGVDLTATVLSILKLDEPAATPGAGPASSTSPLPSAPPAPVPSPAAEPKK